jgi:hypothetical protein
MFGPHLDNVQPREVLVLLSAQARLGRFFPLV